jgi:hypothetical protein
MRFIIGLIGKGGLSACLFFFMCIFVRSYIKGNGYAIVN